MKTRHQVSGIELVLCCVGITNNGSVKRAEGVKVPMLTVAVLLFAILLNVSHCTTTASINGFSKMNGTGAIQHYFSLWSFLTLMYALNSHQRA